MSENNKFNYIDEKEFIPSISPKDFVDSNSGEIILEKGETTTPFKIEYILILYKNDNLLVY